MKKFLLVLSLVFAAVLGFLVGAVVATHHWVNPSREFAKIQAEAFTTVHELSELRKSNIDGIVQSKELQLDSCIVALSVFAKEGGATSEQATHVLRRIATYRKKTGFSSTNEETQRWVNDALKLAAPAP